MPRKPTGRDRSAEDVDRMNALVRSVRRKFDTVEDMTQSFVREAIVTGAFPPGQRLNLDEIAATLGVSRMPVRNGLRQLESEGLIEVSPYRGARVSVLDQSEIAEIYELRILLECYLLDQLMGRLDEALLDRLESILVELDRSEELGTWLEQRQFFYQALYERAGRPRTLAQVSRLRSSVGRYFLLRRVDEPHDHGHERLMARLRARDLAGAQEWLTGHLRSVSVMLQGMVAAAAADGRSGR
jgi:DNA-binding GntR family transcriptional regulator